MQLLKNTRRAFVRYFLIGFVALIPVLLLMHILRVLSGVSQLSWLQLSPIGAPFASIFVIFLFGLGVVHIFERHLHKKLVRGSKTAGPWSLFCRNILNFNHISTKARTAFQNPVLYKVDDGIYKLGFITDQDLSILGTTLTDGYQTTSEATPSPDSVWIYAPAPVTFMGEMILAESRKITPLTGDHENLALYIASAGLIEFDEIKADKD